MVLGLDRFNKMCIFMAFSSLALLVSGCESNNTTMITNNEGIYGEIYYHDANIEVPLILNGNYTKITTFTDIGEYRLTVPSNVSDDITILVDGDYVVSMSFSTKVLHDDILLDTCIFVNNVSQEHMHIQRTFKVNNDVYAGSSSGVLRLHAGDVVDVRTKATNGGLSNTTAIALFGNVHLFYLGHGDGFR